MKEASENTDRKWKNLGKSPDFNNTLNFGDKSAELWCEGGDEKFLQHMISESETFAQSVGWFTSLISKKESQTSYSRALERVKASDVRTINMKQGQKTSRIFAWKIG